MSDDTPPGVDPDIWDAFLNARFVFWCCPAHDRQSVEWRTEPNGDMTPHCLFCDVDGPSVGSTKQAES